MSGDAESTYRLYMTRHKSTSSRHIPQLASLFVQTAVETGHAKPDTISYDFDRRPPEINKARRLIEITG